MSKRQCNGTNTRGEPCGAAPLVSKDHCAAHPPDRESPGFTGFGSSAHARAVGKLGGRPANPKPSEVARRLIEANELVLQKPYWRILGYDVRLGPDGPYLVEMRGGGAKVFGESKDGVVKRSRYDDLGAMMNAAEKLQDRVYGKPKVTTEISGPEGQPIQVELPTDAAWHAEVAAVLEAAGALRGDAQ